MPQKQIITPKEFSAIRLSLQFGYTIIIPLIIFLLIGIFLDNRFKTSPLFIFIGVILSIVISTIGIYKAILPFLEISKKDNNPKDKK
ncbi:MAG: AtpZ/AtpI family protein [Patescibacteria group bacterium]|jgi:F0F1-type ATP synthase assembly protein I